MLTLYLRRYRIMIIASFFFFYLGCGITLSFSRIDCVDAVTNVNKIDAENENKLDLIKYVVLVLSSPNNLEKRDAIRATWANFASNIVVENGETIYRWNHTWTGQRLPQNLIKLYFVVGAQALDEAQFSNLVGESTTHNDLLLLDKLEDSYKNLALKMLHSLKWMRENLKRLKYLIKCDDDSFVRVDLIIRDIEAYGPHMNAPEISEFVSFKNSQPSFKGLYWGYFDGRARVYLKGKWQEKDWFLCDHYLPYALGGGYVISNNIVDYVGRNFDILSHYNSEDVSMGVWTAALDGINRVHDIRFDTEWRSRGCQKSMLVRHKQTPKDMFDMYKTLVHKKGESLCRNETIKWNPYVYKWNVLPSMCCK